ncbi:hypothetical protein D3C73_1549620 [compost metagenome]
MPGIVPLQIPVKTEGQAEDRGCAQIEDQTLRSYFQNCDPASEPKLAEKTEFLAQFCDGDEH